MQVEISATNADARNTVKKTKRYWGIDYHGASPLSCFLGKYNHSHHVSLHTVSTRSTYYFYLFYLFLFYFFWNIVHLLVSDATHHHVLKHIYLTEAAAFREKWSVRKWRESCLLYFLSKLSLLKSSVAVYSGHFLLFFSFSCLPLCSCGVV